MGTHPQSPESAGGERGRPNQDGKPKHPESEESPKQKRWDHSSLLTEAAAGAGPVQSRPGAAGAMASEGASNGQGKNFRPYGTEPPSSAAVPMLPALEVSEEPEKAAAAAALKGKNKDPSYKVLSLVRRRRAFGGQLSPRMEESAWTPKGGVLAGFQATHFAGRL